MDKYADLQQELVKSLTERLLDIDFDIGKRNFFFADVEIEHHIFDILINHLSKRTALAEKVSDLLFETKRKREDFDRRVRECVYDKLYADLGGLA